MILRAIVLIRAAKDAIYDFQGRTMPAASGTSISNIDVGLPPEAPGSDHCG
jgi:hypothetical protein